VNKPSSSSVPSSGKLWIVSELYYPEETSTGYFLTKIAESLADKLEVCVVCAQPTYSERGQRRARFEDKAGVRIYRALSTHFDKDKLLLRILNMLTFTVSTTIYLLKNVSQGDKIMVVTNPPILLPFVGLIARVKCAESYLLVHDVYPDILVATNMLKSSSLIFRVMDWFFQKTYQQFSSVVVLGRDMQEVVGKKLDKQSLCIIPNWGDIAEIMPGCRADNYFVEKYNLSQKTVIQYSGNIGRTHNIDTILSVALKLRHRNDIVFMFVGTGGKINKIQQFADNHVLSNLLILPRQSRERLSEMLSCATASIISFESAMYGLSVPSRMYNAMAAEVPIVAITHKKSELALHVQESDAGWLLQENNGGELCALVLRLATPEGAAEAAAKGKNARNSIVAAYTLERISSAYAQMFCKQIIESGDASC